MIDTMHCHNNSFNSNNNNSNNNRIPSTTTYKTLHGHPIIIEHSNCGRPQRYRTYPPMPTNPSPRRMPWTEIIRSYPPPQPTRQRRIRRHPPVPRGSHRTTTTRRRRRRNPSGTSPSRTNHATIYWVPLSYRRYSCTVWHTIIIGRYRYYPLRDRHNTIY